MATQEPIQRRLARNWRRTLAASSWPIAAHAEPSVAAGTESSGSARASACRPIPKPGWPDFYGPRSLIRPSMIWSVGPNPAARATSVSGGTRRTMVGMDVRDDGLYPALLEPGDHRPGGFGGDALALPGHADRPGDLGGAALVGNAACSMPIALPSPRGCTVQLRCAVPSVSARRLAASRANWARNSSVVVGRLPRSTYSAHRRTRRSARRHHRR